MDTDVVKRLQLLFVATDLSQRLRSTFETGVVLLVVMLLVSSMARLFEIYAVRAKLSEAFMLTSTIRGELVSYRAERGRWPRDESELDHPAFSPGEDFGRYVDHLELGNDGAFFAYFRPEIEPGASGLHVLTFRPASITGREGAPIFWVCAEHEPPPGFSVAGQDLSTFHMVQLPAACRSIRN